MEYQGQLSWDFRFQRLEVFKYSCSAVCRKKEIRVHNLAFVRGIIHLVSCGHYDAVVEPCTSNRPEKFSILRVRRNNNLTGGHYYADTKQGIDNETMKAVEPSNTTT